MMTRTSADQLSLDTQKLQSEHYDQICENYNAHYGDQWSLAYRKRFMDRFLFQGIDLKGKRVLDAACGGGESTDVLQKRGAHVTELDISDRALDAFRARFPEFDAVCASLTDTGLPADSFDCAVVVGAMHHMHPDVDAAVEEVYRILKPGGWFCFVEPHTGSIADIFRRVWYAFDRQMFASNEAAIDVRGLAKRHQHHFRIDRIKFGGSVAYLGVQSSMVLRIPQSWKKYFASTLIAAEAILDPLATSLTSCFAVCRFQKLDVPTTFLRPIVRSIDIPTDSSNTPTQQASRDSEADREYAEKQPF